MPKYHLVVDNKKNYKEIDLTKLKEFDKKSAYKLESIVNFTMGFPSIEKLKMELYDKNLIELGDIDKKLSVIYPYNKEMKKLRNGISLKGDKKYFDQLYLSNFIISNSNNIDFLESICNNYRNSYYSTIIDELKYYIRCLKNNSIDDDVKEMFRNSVKDFVLKETGSIDKNTGEYKINYKKLRDLAMFISYIEKKFNKNTSMNKNERNLEYVQQTFDSIINNKEVSENEIQELEEYYQKIMKKNINTKVSDEEYQIYEDGFPPNSEELKKYQEFQENLEIRNKSK